MSVTKITACIIILFHLLPFNINALKECANNALCQCSTSHTHMHHKKTNQIHTYSELTTYSFIEKKEHAPMHTHEAEADTAPDLHFDERTATVGKCCLSCRFNTKEPVVNSDLTLHSHALQVIDELSEDGIHLIPDADCYENSYFYFLTFNKDNLHIITTTRLIC